MRVANFASQFFSTAILLQQRVELRATCPSSMVSCKYQNVASNLAGALIQDTLLASLHPHMRNDTGTSLGESMNKFGAANISLQGASDYAGISLFGVSLPRTEIVLPGMLAGSPPGLLCPERCFQCSEGRLEGGCLRFVDSCSEHFEPVQVCRL